MRLCLNEFLKYDYKIQFFNLQGMPIIFILLRCWKYCSIFAIFMLFILLTRNHHGIIDLKEKWGSCVTHCPSQETPLDSLYSALCLIPDNSLGSSNCFRLYIWHNFLLKTFSSVSSSLQQFTWLLCFLHECPLNSLKESSIIPIVLLKIT